MLKKYRIKLTKEQRQLLQDLTNRGTIKVRVYKRARVVLLADEAHPDGRKTDEQIAAMVDTSLPTIERLRRQFVQEGLEASLTEKARPGAPKKFTGQNKAQITALACCEPPEGYAKWSLRLLANKLVELELVDSISHKTVGDVLKKTS
jgi:transposase